ncbi:MULTISPECIES: hypothetical protein [unclassified Romboutsia]|uniref:hypothetical protein n=1 Tax=unclassified Romboutsia TaxID=2626894 RepID=UPI00189A619B|nr:MULTISPECIES: hypothetical protein [unclassified Romboutsia]MDB8805118.1 hypothetical protein [Romboutsia sp. 1001216sp1]MDB8808719.1 hypothetical protein [Romboutsia sp. 1001216sp1]MDB8810763.1 hypothetical protein [Romboutsia sp. 1001216sp1]MDB8816483.1 hypothetical protein [Romboutsia sp. 1001216sp1]MDB8820131.1 hypothetical protein [Romboutsia sp. 1001216sp1]
MTKEELKILQMFENPTIYEVKIIIEETNIDLETIIAYYRGGLDESLLCENIHRQKRSRNS